MNIKSSKWSKILGNPLGSRLATRLTKVYKVYTHTHVIYISIIHNIQLYSLPFSGTILKCKIHVSIYFGEGLEIWVYIVQGIFYTPPRNKRRPEGCSETNYFIIYLKQGIGGTKQRILPLGVVPLKRGCKSGVNMHVYVYIYNLHIYIYIFYNLYTYI